MRSTAAWLLGLCGVALVFIGGYFVAARPPILPEDARFMGSSAEALGDRVPALTTWLRRVFWVLGGYILTTGILVVFIASSAVRSGNAAGLVVLAVAGITSLGWMSAVNFMIRSDFKWALLGLSSIWVVGLAFGVAAR